MDLFQAIHQRRSVRKYTNTAIDRAVMVQLLDAARWSPNGGNNNDWRFVVVTSPVQKKLLLQFAPGVDAMPAAIIVVCIQPSQRQVKEAIRLLHMADAAIASQNIALAAHGLGIGSCIVVSFAEVALRALLDLPDKVTPYILVTLGYPDETPEPPPRLPIEAIAFYDEYGREWGS
jgi:nitroreductase